MNEDSGGGSPPPPPPVPDDSKIDSTMETQKPEITDNKFENKKTQKKTVYNYKNTDLGPFMIYIENSQNSDKFNYFKIARDIYNLKLNDVKKITIKGRNKLGIEFINFNTANKMLNNEILLKKGYNIFIPFNYALCKGIVRNIDITVSDQELFDCTRSPFKISEIKRLNRRVLNHVDKSVQYEPTGTILFTFEGTLLPRFVNIFGLSFPVSTYIPPVTQCYTCLLYGHTRLQCKGKKKCFTCTENHEEDTTPESECNIKCWHCDSITHKSNDKKCPEYNRQKSIKYLMATENLSFYDANIMCPRTFVTSRDLKKLDNIKEYRHHTSDFPSLSKNQSPPDNNAISINQRRLNSPDQLYNSKRSYTQATSDNPKKRSIYKSHQGFDKEAHNNLLYTPNSRPEKFLPKNFSFSQPASASSDTVYSIDNPVGKKSDTDIFDLIAQNYTKLDKSIKDKITKFIITTNKLNVSNPDHDKPKDRDIFFPKY